MPSRQLANMIAVAIGLASGFSPLRETDGWAHLATGRLITGARGLPQVDSLSFTRAGEPWVIHSWLWDTIAFQTHALLGDAGLVFLRALITGLIAHTMYRIAIRRGASPASSATFVGLAMVCLVGWLAEGARLLQPLFVTAALHLMLSYRRGGRGLMLAYPVLMLLWANCHVSAMLGLVLLGLFGLCELMRAPLGGIRLSLPVLLHEPSKLLAFVFVLSLVACFVTPYGADGVRLALRFAYGSLGGSPGETIPAVGDWPVGTVIFLGLLTFAALAVTPRSPAPFDLLSVLLSAWALVRWGRGASVFIPLAAPVAAMHYSAWIRGLRGASAGRSPAARASRMASRASWTAVAWGILIVGGAWVAGRGVALVAAGNREAAAHLPVAAADYLERSDTRGNMFNAAQWGGYLMWRFGTQRPVFVDGRAGLYGPDILREYQTVWRAGPGWRGVLDRHEVAYLLVETDAPICQVLEVSDTFERAYQDPLARVYKRVKRR